MENTSTKYYNPKVFIDKLTYAQKQNEKLMIQVFQNGSTTYLETIEAFDIELKNNKFSIDRLDINNFSIEYCKMYADSYILKGSGKNNPILAFTFADWIDKYL